MLENGKVIKVNSDIFTVKCGNESISCKVRGKIKNRNIIPLVGDNVSIDKDKCVIEEILERRNSLNRPMVSNIDIGLIVTSIVSPNINLTLLDKLISIVVINNIEPVIVFTKIDISSKEDKKKIKELSKYYEKIGIKVFNNNKPRKIKKYLKNKIVTVIGQTGAGKSTLINSFDKNLKLNTDEISEALGRGKHTTRITELFEIKNFYIVDTPGFSSIDINKYSEEEIRNSFFEFKDSNCKYKDCKHVNELGCMIRNNNNILKSRYDNYIRFIKE